MNIDKWLDRLRHKKALAEFTDLAGWRNYYFDLILFLSLILLPIALIASLPTYIAGKNFGVIAFEIGIFILLLILFSMRDSSLRGVILLFFGYFMVITFFISLGPFYARPGWLVLCSVTAALLFGVQAAITTTVINAALLIVLYVFFGPNLQSWAPVYMEPASKWIIFVVSLSTISLVASLPVSLLLKRLNTSFFHERDLRNKLSHESELLQSTNSSLQNEIAERRRSEEALREGGRIYRLLIDTSTDIISRHMPDSTIMYITPSSERMLGYKPDEMIGRRIRDFVVPGDMGRILSAIQSARDRGEDRYLAEFRMTRRDGSFMWAETLGMLIPDEQGNLVEVHSAVRDISERKQAEEALQKSEERYRTLVENASDIVFRTDDSGHFTFVNTAALRITGYTEKELIGKHYHTLIRPDMREEAIKLLVLQLENRVHNKYFEFPVLTKNGKEMWIGQNTQLIIEGNHVSGFQAVARDITERKRAEKALEESEARFRAFMDYSPSLVIIKDHELRPVYFNRPSGEIFPAEEWMGKTPENTFPQDIADSMIDNDKLTLAKGYVQYEETWIDKIGNEHVFETRKFRIERLDAPPLLGVIINDITDRKRAEETMLTVANEWQNTFDAVSSAVWLLDKNQRIIRANKATAAIFGIEPSEVLGCFCWEVVHKISGPHPECPVIRMKGSLRRESMELTRGESWLEIVVDPILDDKDCIQGIVHIVSDITQRKRSEEEKKKLENQLNQAQKMESIGTLAGGIAHDFNNLLMGILGNASLILIQLDRSHPAYDRLKNIEDYVQRGSDLTKQLLGFARSGKYETKPTNLAEFIRVSSELFGRTKKEIRIYRNAQEDLWAVEVDQGQMEQVLLNLYVNAWQAMPGGGDLYLSAENAGLDDVDVGHYPYDINPGKYVKITVTDTGIGMDEPTMARIFEPFFTTKEKGRGTGLGLASAYGIIKNHGGFILVESEKGHGTSFIIYLPASNKVVETDSKTEDELQTGKETVLLIDDEEMILDVGANMLKGLGYKVMTAIGGKQGLTVYEQNKDSIDIVILDMIMPEITGRETFDTMLQIDSFVKVLLSSGYSLDGQAKEIIQRGCKGFIQKPFTLAELSKKVRVILDDR